MLTRSLLVALLCAACSSIAPAEAPPQLIATPGAFIQIGPTKVETGLFSLEYPASWRVVKLNSAHTPMLRLVFVAPDQSALHLTQLREADSSAEAGDRLRLDNGVLLRIELETSAAPDESFTRLAKRLVASIRSGNLEPKA